MQLITAVGAVALLSQAVSALPNIENRGSLDKRAPKPNGGGDKWWNSGRSGRHRNQHKHKGQHGGKKGHGNGEHNVVEHSALSTHTETEGFMYTKTKDYEHHTTAWAPEETELVNPVYNTESGTCAPGTTITSYITVTASSLSTYNSNSTATASPDAGNLTSTLSSSKNTATASTDSSSNSTNIGSPTGPSNTISLATLATLTGASYATDSLSFTASYTTATGFVLAAVTSSASFSNATGTGLGTSPTTLSAVDSSSGALSSLSQGPLESGFSSVEGTSDSGLASLPTITVSGSQIDVAATSSSTRGPSNSVLVSLTTTASESLQTEPSTGSSSSTQESQSSRFVSLLLSSSSSAQGPFNSGLTPSPTATSLITVPVSEGTGFVYIATSSVSSLGSDSPGPISTTGSQATAASPNNPVLTSSVSSSTSDVSLSSVSSAPTVIMTQDPIVPGGSVTSSFSTTATGVVSGAPLSSSPPASSLGEGPLSSASSSASVEIATQDSNPPLGSGASSTSSPATNVIPGSPLSSSSAAIVTATQDSNVPTSTVTSSNTSPTAIIPGSPLSTSTTGQSTTTPGSDNIATTFITATAPPLSAYTPLSSSSVSTSAFALNFTATPISLASGSITTPSTTIPATTTITAGQASGTPNPAAVHCGVHGNSNSNYFIGEYIDEGANIPISLFGCYEECLNTYRGGACVAYEYFLQEGLGAPRCNLYAGSVAQTLMSINRNIPNVWFDLGCGAPVAGN